MNSRAGVDYLEFGVWKGRSLDYWTKLNRDPESRFIGFDTFTGLPEDWDITNPAGTFDVQGHVPRIDDSRVSFVAGLFQKTLPSFIETFRPRGQLVVHFDCDLYSATLYVLAKLDHLIAPGTILMFDEFGDVRHEFRAYHDYSASHMRECKLVSASVEFYTVAFEVVR